MPVDTVEQLLAREQLRELGLRYAQGIDRKNVELLSSIFTDDAELVSEQSTLGPGGKRIAEGILEYHDEVCGYDTTMHFVGNQTVNIDGDTATGETYCFAVHWYTEKHQQYMMFLRYQDEYRHENDDWYFSQRTIEVDEDYVYTPPPTEQ